MKDWKLRQMLSDKILVSDDIHCSKNVIEETTEDLIVQRALEYPTIQTNKMYYPGKAYSIAIIYAYLIHVNFKERFLRALSDPNLLPKQPYFKPYAKDTKPIYKAILDRFPFDLINKPEIDNLKKTIEYFEKDYFLHPETKYYYGAI